MAAMKHLRLCSGWLALSFGIIGMLACFAAIAGGWIWSFQVRASLDRAAGQVTGFTGRLSDRSGEASAWLAESQATIGGFQKELETSVEGALERRGVDPEEFEAIARQVRTAVNQVREWLVVAESSGAVVDLLRGVVDSIGGLVSSDLGSGAGEALAQTLQEVRETGIAMEELRGAVEEAMAAGASGVDTRRARSILDRSATALASLQGHTDAMQAAVDEVEVATLELQSRLHERLSWTLGVGTVLLLWQAVAQWSLARWGGGVVRGGEVSG